jgi:hypothetical protein
MLHDEQARAAQMPTEAQAATVRPSVREDITAHPEGIVRIAKKAQEILRAVKEEEVKFLYADARALFLQKEPEPTLWWLMHAIFILSHHRHQNFGWRRGSFGRWLVPFAEKDILHFDVIARITADGLHRMLELRDPVAQAWRRDKDVSGKDWAARLAEAAKCSPSTVYTRRGLWWKEHKINIALPQQFYSDVLHFGQSSTTRPENVTKMLTAVKGKDGDRLVQLYAAAQANFQRERVTILNPALLAPPLAMPLESPRDIRPDIIEDGDEASVSAAPASRPPKPAAINLKAPRVRKKPKRVKPAAPQKRAPPKPRGRPFPRIEED